MSEKVHMKAFPSHSNGKRESSEKMYLSTFNYHSDRNLLMWILFEIASYYLYYSVNLYFFENLIIFTAINSFSFTFRELN